METELKALEARITLLAQSATRLRAENQQLRQDLLAAQAHSRLLEERITAASKRLETLVARLPEASE